MVKDMFVTQWGLEGISLFYNFLADVLPSKFLSFQMHSWFNTLGNLWWIRILLRKTWYSLQLHNKETWRGSCSIGLFINVIFDSWIRENWPRNSRISLSYLVLCLFQPIVMVAWSCFYSSSEVDIEKGKEWIKQKAMKGPATHVTENGQYQDGIKSQAETVSDKHDTLLCPDEMNVSIFQWCALNMVVMFDCAVILWRTVISRSDYQ